MSKIVLKRVVPSSVARTVVVRAASWRRVFRSLLPASALLAAALAFPVAGAAPHAAPKIAAAAPATNAVEIVRDGEYTSREDVAAYVRKFSGALPKNFITKARARALGWPGGPLEPYAPGKSIGGDRFGNYERRLPALNGGFYKECDIDTRGKPRGAKRLVFTAKGKRIYYTDDHYRTFREVE